MPRIQPHSRDGEERVRLLWNCPSSFGGDTRIAARPRHQLPRRMHSVLPRPTDRRRQPLGGMAGLGGQVEAETAAVHGAVWPTPARSWGHPLRRSCANEQQAVAVLRARIITARSSAHLEVPPAACDSLKTAFVRKRGDATQFTCARSCGQAAHPQSPAHPERAGGPETASGMV